MSNWGGLGKLQRNWVLERDGHRCQFLIFNDNIGKWIQCQATEDLHVHHILPQRWHKTHMPWRDPHRPTNLITLCGRKHHNGPKGIHPDMHRALINYRAGNKEAFDDEMKARQKLVEHGHIYWNPEFDWMLLKISRVKTARYSREKKYPEKRRRKGWQKPKR